MNRKEAEKAYFEALQNLAAAEEISEKAYQVAWEKLEDARSALVMAEIENPTKREIKKENNYLRLANRGLC